MVEDVKVPVLPESVSDAVLSKWHKEPGDAVQEGDVLAELETDKIMLEVPAIVTGVLQAHLIEEGARVEAQQVLCRIDTDVSESNTVVDNHKDDTTAVEKMRQSKQAAKRAQGPRVREVLRQENIAEETIPVTNTDRLTNDDLDNYKQKQAADSAQVQSRQERLVPMTRLRKTIATRLLESQRETASLTTFNEVDLSQVMALRSKYKDAFIEKYGVKLGFMSFFTKACCLALQAYPEVNASIDGDQVRYHDYCDIGIAVSTDKGLFVPIIRDAELLSMADIEKAIALYAQKAKAQKIAMDDLTGGTFSITNGGIFGSMLSTPILNPPQSAILGMHNIVKRPVVVDDKIQIRPMMYLALTYDHRMIDGSQAVRFLVMVKSLLEDPEQLLLHI